MTDLNLGRRDLIRIAAGAVTAAASRRSLAQTAKRPVRLGMAESTSRPGHNATGFSDVLSALGGKLIGFAQDMNNPRKDVDYLWHTNWPDGQERLRVTEQAALSAGLNLRSRGIAEIGEAESAILDLKNNGASTLLVQPSPFTYRQRAALISIATKHLLGTIFAFPI